MENHTPTGLAECALKLLASGVSVIACHPATKQPIIKGWSRYANHLPYRATLERWWQEAPCANLAIICGELSNLFVVDLDGPVSDAQLVAALGHFGPTPLIVKTPGKAGKGPGYHLYYRYNGEKGRHKITVAGVPIDLLAQGIVMAVGSKHPDGGHYRIHTSDPDWMALLAELPVCACPEAMALAARKPRVYAAIVNEGERGDFIYDQARTHALNCDTLDELCQVMEKENTERCKPCLPSTDVTATCKGVWLYKEQNRLWVRGGPAVVGITMAIQEKFKGKPRAQVLWQFLRLKHALREGSFAIAQRQVGKLLGMDKGTVGTAIRQCLGLEVLKLVYQGGGGDGDPSLYCWPENLFSNF